jgi:ATP-dependent Clp protease ATP-binding subunit ClpA
MKDNGFFSNGVWMMSLNLTENLTAKATSFQVMSPSRQATAQKLAEVLTRSQCQHPILLGEPGSGKTTFLRQFAGVSEQQKVPGVWQNMQIRRLDIDDLYARNAAGFVETLARIFAAAETASRKTLLFLDQVERLLVYDASSWLQLLRLVKQAWRRGRFCLGLVCCADFYYQALQVEADLRPYIESVALAPLADKDVVQVIGEHFVRQKAIKALLEDSVLLSSAIQLSKRFVTSMALPQSVLLLIDKTIAHIKQHQFGAVELHWRREDFISVLAGWFGVYAENQAYYEPSRLQDLGVTLSKTIIGQKAALMQLSETLPRFLQEDTIDTATMPCLLFCGSPSVGKQMTARALHTFLFGHHIPVLRLDLAYVDVDDVSSLIAAHYKQWRQGLVVLSNAQSASTKVLYAIADMLASAKLTLPRQRDLVLRHVIVVLVYDSVEAVEMAYVEEAAVVEPTTTDSILQLVVRDLPTSSRTKKEARTTSAKRGAIKLPESLLEQCECIDFQPLSFSAFTTIAEHCLQRLAQQFFLKTARSLSYPQDLIRDYLLRFDTSKSSAKQVVDQLKRDLGLALNPFFGEESGDKRAVFLHISEGGLSADEKQSRNSLKTNEK